jgi:hypothetical protein
MAIAFPGSPQTNDLHTVGSFTYKYDGDKWIGVGLTPIDRLIEGSNSLEITAGNDLIWTGDRVGLNTSSPEAKLEVRDTGAQGIIIRSENTQSTDTNKALRIRNNSNTDTVTISHRGQLGLGQNIDSGVGTNLHIREANPGGDVGLRIQNHTTVDAGTTASLYLTTTTGAFDTAHIQVARSDGDLRFKYGAAEAFRVYSTPSEAVNRVVAEFRDHAGGTDALGYVGLTAGYSMASTEGQCRIGAMRNGNGNTASFVVATNNGSTIGTFYNRFRINPGEGDIIFYPGQTFSSPSVINYSQNDTNPGYTTIRPGDHNNQSRGTIIQSNNADGGWSAMYINKFAWNVGDDVRYIDLYKNGASHARLQLTSDGANVELTNQSDYRLKQDIETFTGASDLVKSLRVCDFRWKDNPDHPYKTVGFIAHEVDEIIPDLVRGEKDGNRIDEEGNEVVEYQALDQTRLVPYLTAALQEALAEIETLKTRLEAGGL